MFRQCIRTLVVALAGGEFLFSPSIFAQLPSESMLPGRHIQEPNLPGESQLPPGFAVARVAEIEPDPVDAAEPAPSLPPELPSESTPRTAVSLPDLPGESLLPDLLHTTVAADQTEEDVEAVGEDLLKLTQSADAIAWLRLHGKGHAGPVRALAFTGDSTRLCSAGEDKAILVWSPTGQNSRWQYERSIYWQVQRGNRGRVYAIASRGDLIAMGGHGAMGGLGEILLVNAVSGKLESVLYDEQLGHRQVIVSLAFSPDAQRSGLTSVDRSGRALFWQPDAETGMWKPRELQPRDSVRYGDAVAGRLFPHRGIVPVAMVDGQHVVLPMYVTDPRRKDAVSWQLQKINVMTGASELWAGQAGQFHIQMVTALAVSEDGSHMASADAAGRLLLWSREGGAATLQLDRACIALAYSSDGRTLIAGTAKSPKGESAKIQTWDVSDPLRPKKLQDDINSPHDAYACQISRDGRLLAYTCGSEIVVRSLAGEEEQRLRGNVRSPLVVAFAKERPFYRIAWGREAGDQRPALEQTFDPSHAQLGSVGRVDEKEWIPSSWYAAGWSVQTVRDPQTGSESYRLTHQGAARGRIPFEPALHGAPSAWCWIPTRQGKPFAAAVGTNGNNNIYVLRLTESGTCPVLRVLRGHAGSITSLGISRDLRYLVSGALDGTVRVWPLSGLHDKDELFNRWGATWAIEDGELRVAGIREEGPLYFRGMRPGDVIRTLHWADPAAEGGLLQRESSDPSEMLQKLTELPWDTLVAFQYTRGRMPGRAFQMFPAWQQLVSFVVADNRQWAYWSPTGYYDASFEGHELFGWQVNRGLQVLPDFFLAAQLRPTLERPEVMSRLLDTGSIEEAFRVNHVPVPANPQRAVVDARLGKPEIEILSPQPADVAATETVLVKAAISIRNGQQLVPPKVFANGVVAVNRELVDVQSIPGGCRMIYQWEARLPSQPRILLQVVAATDAEMTARESLTIARELPAERPAARLFVATAGVNQYLDSQMPRLDFAVNNARQVATTLTRYAAPLYDTQAISLSNDKVTRNVWNAALQQYANTLRASVLPDDVLLIFLSGHGLRDPVADDYYYLTANARYSDVMGHRYADCLSMEDFAVFGDVPCRKLVILDTCHSGALQPLGQRELKAALRALQNDVVFTLTASEGGQEAVEDRQRNLGRFTSRLLEALQGAADAWAQGGNGDGVASWKEIVDYVQRMVTADSLGDTYQQYPTAGPLELLEVADFPLTALGSPASLGGTRASPWQLVEIRMARRAWFSTDAPFATVSPAIGMTQ